MIAHKIKPRCRRVQNCIEGNWWKRNTEKTKVKCCTKMIKRVRYSDAIFTCLATWIIHASVFIKRPFCVCALPLFWTQNAVWLDFNLKIHQRKQFRGRSLSFAQAIYLSLFLLFTFFLILTLACSCICFSLLLLTSCAVRISSKFVCYILPSNSLFFVTM